MKTTIVVFAGSDKNFVTKLIMSNADIRSSGTAANTLALTDVTPTLDNSATETAALGGLGSLTYSGTASITLDSTKCATTLFLCVSVLVSGTPYTDKDTSNNYRCKDITDQVNCAVGECSFTVMAKI